MNWWLQIQEAYANIISSKLRSFLAVLGILVGTGSVVAMVSGGQLATAHALKQFSELGTDLLAVSVMSNSSDSTPELSTQDVMALQKKIPAIVNEAPYSTVYTDVSYQGEKIQANIIGSVPELQEVVQITLSMGRFISRYDNYEPYCVIGKEIAESLRKQGIKNPLNKQLRVGSRYYTIIGVANDWKENAFFNNDINKSLIIPINTAKFISAHASISNIVMKLVEYANIDLVQQQIEKEFQRISSDKQLFFRSAKQLIDSMTSQRNTLTLLLALIGSIALIVGGIGVMNIMLVSVVERRREIGIRKAVGASSKDIRELFLVEAIALSVLGGLLGVLVGLFTSYIIATFAGWQFEIFLLPPMVGFFVSVAVGIFFGFYPAYKASLLDPIQTLRAD